MSHNLLRFGGTTPIKIWWVSNHHRLSLHVYVTAKAHQQLLSVDKIHNGSFNCWARWHTQELKFTTAQEDARCNTPTLLLKRCWWCRWHSRDAHHRVWRCILAHAPSLPVFSSKQIPAHSQTKWTSFEFQSQTARARMYCTLRVKFEHVTCFGHKSVKEFLSSVRFWLKSLKLASSFVSVSFFDTSDRYNRSKNLQVELHTSMKIQQINW